MTYDTSRRTAEACITEKLLKMEEECKEGFKNLGSGYFKCKVEKRKAAMSECDQFGPIQKALQLVFGANTSPGFICGVKDAVVYDRIPMPGSCCLDAPYELDGDSWGQPVSSDYTAPHPLFV